VRRTVLWVNGKSIGDRRVCPREELAGGVKLAACMRAHGFPAFPDPYGQGKFVLYNFDVGSPQVQSAFKTCDPLTKFKGPMRVGISNQGP
jgi:hypothetical protein